MNIIAINIVPVPSRYRCPFSPCGMEKRVGGGGRVEVLTVWYRYPVSGLEIASENNIILNPLGSFSNAQ
jgi:hypothetical protein